MNSKIGILAKLALQIWGSEAMPKQPMFKNMGDTGSPEDGDASADKNQVLSSFVYT